MGQYFRAVNVTKREYVDGNTIGVGTKLWEWCANRGAAVFPYLLRKSTDTGYGDIDCDNAEFAGRWAGDTIYLIGDNDESKLYEEAGQKYVNISVDLVTEFNKFIEVESLKLRLW